MTSYKWPRVLRSRSWVTQPLCAARGIKAGDVFVMGLLMAYLWQSFHRIADAHPAASLRAYVDDAQFQVVGPPVPSSS